MVIAHKMRGRESCIFTKASVRSCVMRVPDDTIFLLSPAPSVTLL